MHRHHHHRHGPNPIDYARMAAASRAAREAEETRRMIYYTMTPQQRAAYDADKRQRDAAESKANTRWLIWFFVIMLLAYGSLWLYTQWLSSPACSHGGC